MRVLDFEKYDGRRRAWFIALGLQALVFTALTIFITPFFFIASGLVVSGVILSRPRLKDYYYDPE